MRSGVGPSTDRDRTDGQVGALLALSRRSQELPTHLLTGLLQGPFEPMSFPRLLLCVCHVRDQDFGFLDKVRTVVGVETEGLQIDAEAFSTPDEPGRWRIETPDEVGSHAEIVSLAEFLSHIHGIQVSLTLRLDDSNSVAGVRRLRRGGDDQVRPRTQRTDLAPKHLLRPQVTHDAVLTYLDGSGLPGHLYNIGRG